MEYNVTGIENECPIWKAFRDGDANALARIFSEHYDSLYHYGRKLVQDEDLVKDCVQNLFLKMWTSRERLMAVRSVKPYLLKSLRRHISDQVTSLNRKKNVHHEFMSQLEITFSHEEFLIALQVSKEQSAQLARCLNTLSARKREAVFLRFYEGLDYEKIAEVMSLNVQSVRNLIHQSLQSIKNQMSFSSPATLLNIGLDSQVGTT